MKILKRFYIPIIIVVFISSCQNPASEISGDFDPSELKKEIAKEWVQFFDAWVNGDAKKSATFFKEDGIHFRPGAAIDSGRINIEETFSKMLSAFKVEYCYQTTLDIEIFDNTIIEYGTYVQKWANTNNIMKGSYIAVWEKTDRDGIKISRLIFN